MSQKKQTSPIPGVTREEEIQTLSEVLAIAEENLNRTRASVRGLQEELHELKEVYDVEDKEGLAQWFNADARFMQVKQDLLRSERSRKKPYFGRIDFTDLDIKRKECYYIGKSVIAKDAAKPKVIDWRAPIASVYYEKSIGKCTYSVKGEGAFEIDLTRKRTYEIDEDQLVDFYDSDVVANDDLLTKYLARNKRAVLSEIIATIQQEQNEIIRKKPQHNVIVQGGAGSGKTTVAMHRISYILYNYDLEFKPKDFYIIGSNRILLNYITGILPDLDVYGVSQMTMEQLFIRLLYEDWDPKTYTVKSLNKGDPAACIKGSFSWFEDLEDFCLRYEWSQIPREDIYIEKTQSLLMTKGAIEKLLKKFRTLSFQDKKDKLTEHLIAQLENEIYGRYYSYPPAEQKALLKYYQTYFGRRDWKGSIFELYDDFLLEQAGKGYHVPLPGTELDLYDLAALSYIYKRIKETDVIQEASHVVIDEAQDFGMMVYGALKYCLSKCTYTIMGDVSQNIYFAYGLQDWEQLRKLMLPGEFDCFEILTKSYRNTVEISNFAMHILQHGNFPVYPVEPIIRHGEEVQTLSCKDGSALEKETCKIIGEWKEKGYETIAVICRDEKEAAEAAKRLQKHMEIREFNAQTEEFGNGVMVLPIEFSKGLEFDAVLLYNACEENYPPEDGFAKLLYVATTRALHELKVLHTGKVTDLIGTPVPEEKKQKILIEKPKPRKIVQEEPKTKLEIELELAKEGHREMALRDAIGPKRIVVNTRPDSATVHSKSVQVKNPASAVNVRKPLAPVSYTGKISSAKPKEEVLTKQTEFGDLPATTSLRPLGHAAVNTAVRWVNCTRERVEISSSYGVLRLEPLADNTVRVSFTRDSFLELPPLPEEVLKTAAKWNCRELRDRVEVTMGKLILRVDKKSGALSVFTEKERLLLAENARCPRQLEKTAKKQTWSYFDWSKKEILKARGVADSDWLDLNATAKYISFGERSKRPACVLSTNGYQLLFPAGKKVMCCTIPAYGNYLYTEGYDQIDYIFRSAL